VVSPMRKASRPPNRRRTINKKLPRYVYPNGNGFRALIRSDYKILYLGTFATADEASKVAERMAKKLRGAAYTPVSQPRAPITKRKVKVKRQTAKRP